MFRRLASHPVAPRESILLHSALFPLPLASPLSPPSKIRNSLQNSYAPLANFLFFSSLLRRSRRLNVVFSSSSFASVHRRVHFLVRLFPHHLHRDHHDNH